MRDGVKEPNAWTNVFICQIYRGSDLLHSKGRNEKAEEEYEDQWQERKYYRQSIKEGRPEYIHKKLSDYEGPDPFGIEKEKN